MNNERYLLAADLAVMPLDWVKAYIARQLVASIVGHRPVPPAVAARRESERYGWHLRARA